MFEEHNERKDLRRFKQRLGLLSLAASLAYASYFTLKTAETRDSALTNIKFFLLITILPALPSLLLIEAQMFAVLVALYYVMRRESLNAYRFLSSCALAMTIFSGYVVHHGFQSAFILPIIAIPTVTVCIGYILGARIIHQSQDKNGWP